MSEVDSAVQVRLEMRGRGGWNPWLRLLAVTLWSSFLGAALSTVVLLFLPDNWTLPLSSLGSIGLTFLLMWLLSMVPALLAAVLAAPRIRGA